MGFFLNDNFYYIDGTTAYEADDESLCGPYGHAVTVIGYTPGEEGEETTVTEYVRRRRRMTRRERRRRRCRNSYEWRCGRRRCCWWEEVETTVTGDGNGTFEFQNQWGTSWGNAGRWLAKGGEGPDGNGWCGW